MPLVAAHDPEQSSRLRPTHVEMLAMKTTFRRGRCSTNRHCSSNSSVTSTSERRSMTRDARMTKAGGKQRLMPSASCPPAVAYVQLLYSVQDRGEKKRCLAWRRAFAPAAIRRTNRHVPHRSGVEGTADFEILGPSRPSLLATWRYFIGSCEPCDANAGGRDHAW